MSHLTILIPAAGASSRMRGQDKLLLDIDGQPLIRRTAITALAAHPKVVITLRPQDHARTFALHDLPLKILTLDDAAEGLSASLRAGAVACNGHLMILPADMPDLTPDDLRALIAAADLEPLAILRGTAADGTPGHPVIFPPDLLPAFAHLRGDAGARAILQANKARIRLLALPDAHALTDLDTPEAWAAWRQTASNTRAS